MAHVPVFTRRAVVAAPVLGAGLACAGIARAGGHGFETVFHFPAGEQPRTRPLNATDALGRRRRLNIVTRTRAWSIALDGDPARDAGVRSDAGFSCFTQASDGLAYGTHYVGVNGAGVICRWNVPRGRPEDWLALDPEGSQGLQLEGGLIEGFDGALYGTARSGGAHRQGCILRITRAGKVTVLHDFDVFHDAEGYAPAGGLVRGSDGHCYGATELGGELDPGTLYRLSPDGTVTFIHAFGAFDDGLPSAGPTQAPDGLLYGTTPSYGYGTLYSISHGGEFRQWHRFTPHEGKWPRASLFAAPDGSLIGTCSSGGRHDAGTVFRFRPDSPDRLEVLHHFTGGADGGAPFAGFEMAADGRLYSTASQGGLHGGGTLFRLRP